MQDWERHALPHGDITALDERLWQVTGSLPQGSMPRNMTLYRLDDGGLLIHGAQALREATMQQLEGLGPPRVMIVASPFHSLHEALYKQRYPQLTVLCPAAARSKVEGEVSVDGTVEEQLAGFGVRWLGPDGLKPIERAYELPLANGHALLMGDILMNLPHLPGFGGVVMRLLGSTGYLGMTRVGRMLLLQEKVAFRRWLEAQAARPELRLVAVAHGTVVTEQACAELRSAAARL